MVSIKYNMQIFYEGTRFLRIILKKKQEKYNDLDEKMKNLVVVVVDGEGILICSLAINRTKEVLVQEKALALFDLVEMIEVNKAAVEKKYPLTSALSFPRTNELGVMDFVLRKLKDLTSGEIDLVPFAGDIILAVQENLVFLRSFLENIAELRSQHEKLQTLQSIQY